MDLRKRRTPNTKPPDVKAIPGNPEQTEQIKPKLTAAERQRLYRQRVKENPEKYQQQKDIDRLRSKLWRMKRSEEQKQRDRDLCRKRSVTFRAKHANDAKPAPKKTRKATLAQAEKWREYKRKERAEMSAQKRRRVNERRRVLYAEKKEAKKKEEEEKASRNIENTPSPYTSDNAKRKAISRSLRILPRSPEKFAEVLSSVVGKSTPRRKSALKQRCILSPSSKHKLKFYRKMSVKNLLKQIRDKRSKRYIQLRRLVHQVTVVKNKLRKKNAHKHLGLSWKFLSSSSNRTLDSRKKRSDALDESIKNQVQSYYQRVDVSRELPCRSGVNMSKRVMECSLKKWYSLFCEENPKVMISFNAFYKLKPKNIKPMSATKLLQCLCEYCVNINYLLQSLNMKCAQVGHTDTLKDKYDAVNATLCPHSGAFPSMPCVNRVCEECGSKVLQEKFQILLKNHGGDEVKWKEWTTKNHDQTCKMALVDRHGTLRDLISQLEDKIGPFAKHLFNARWQGKEFNFITKNVPHATVVFCLDFGENYNCHFQDEAQSAHWSYNQATIHSIVAYHRCTHLECNQITRHSMVMLSNDRRHDQDAVQHFVALGNDHLKAEGVNFVKEIHFSDGSPTQYKSKVNFCDMSFGEQDFGVSTEKHFFGSRHGKGPCDGEIGVIKRSALTAVTTRQTVISDAKSLYQYLHSHHTIPKDQNEHVHFKRTFFYTEEGAIQRQRDRHDHLKPIKDTRSKHHFKGISPYAISSRERSCFCSSCLEGTPDCKNQEYTGCWETSSLTPRQTDHPDNPTKTRKSCWTDDAQTCVKQSSSDSTPSQKPSMQSPAGVQSSRAPLTSLSTVLSPDNNLDRQVEIGDFAAVILKGKQSSSIFMAEVIDVADEDVHLKYMKRSAGELYIWPSAEDSSWEPRTCIVSRVRYPELANKREQFRFLAEDMMKIRKCLSKSLPFC